jgi:hypothetical protein
MLNAILARLCCGRIKRWRRKGPGGPTGLQNQRSAFPEIGSDQIAHQNQDFFVHDNRLRRAE